MPSSKRNVGENQGNIRGLNSEEGSKVKLRGQFIISLPLSTSPILSQFLSFDRRITLNGRSIAGRARDHAAITFRSAMEDKTDPSSSSQQRAQLKSLSLFLPRTRFPSSLAIIDILLTRPFREPITPSCL